MANREGPSDNSTTRLEKNAPIKSLPFRYGKYELVARLGSGGMAEIFLARQAGAGGFVKPTVIKRILPQLAEDERVEAAFIAEARLMAEVRHHNVVHVYELDRLPSGEFFMAMEYVEGTDLRALLKSATRAGLRLPPWMAVKITCDILDALHMVHDLKDDRGRSRNVVHRDVTPSNIFISAQGDVKLGDFGVAKDDQRRTLTRRGEVKGKVAYMAPEQLARGTVDRRADLFSMGVVLWECLSQRRLFGGGELPDLVVMNMICTGPRIAPSRFRRDVHVTLDACVLRALNADPEARHQTAEGFQTELLEILDTIHGPVHSPEICETAEMILGRKPPSERLFLATVTPEGSESDKWDGSWDQRPTEVGSDLRLNPPPSIFAAETSYRGPFPFWIREGETIKGPIHYFDSLKLLAKGNDAGDRVLISADRLDWFDASDFADLTGQEAIRPPEDERTAVIHGALKDCSLIAMLALLGLERSTGILRVSGTPERALIHVSDGVLTHISSTSPRQQTVELLVRDGLIQPADIPALVHRLLIGRTPLEEFAVSAGWGGDSLSFWRSVMKRRLLAILESRAEYDFFTVEPRVRAPLGTDLVTLLPELVRQGMSGHGLRLRLGKAIDTPLSRSPDFEEMFNRFGPDELDTEIVEHLTRTRTVNAAIHGYPDDESSLLAWAYLLVESGALLLEDTEAGSGCAVIAE